jgi:hypothetical protein
MSSLSLHLTYRANPNVLINNNFRTFSGETGCFCHTIGKNKIILQLSKVLTYTYILLTFFFLLAQPYMLSSIKLFLWSGNRRKYRYFIETSVDKSNWKIAADRRNEDCTSWQMLQFDQRPVVYISITGTHSTVIIDNVSFKCLTLAEKLFHLKICRNSIFCIWSVETSHEHSCGNSASSNASGSTAVDLKYAVF